MGEWTNPTDSKSVAERPAIACSNRAAPVIFMTCLPSGKADGCNPSMSAFDSYTGLNF